MDQISMNEVAAQLGCNRTTVERRLKRLKIQPKKGTGDGRYKYITVRDMQRLVISYDETMQRSVSAGDMPQIRSISTKKLMQRIEALEAENAALLQRIEALETQRDTLQSLSSVSAAYPLPPRRATQRLSSRPPLPLGWHSLDGFCTQHGISHTTVRHAIEAGRLPMPHKGEWQEGRAIIRNALDEDMQAAILAKYGKQ